MQRCKKTLHERLPVSRQAKTPRICLDQRRTPSMAGHRRPWRCAGDEWLPRCTLHQPALAPTGIRFFYCAPPPANPARIPVNASVDRYYFDLGFKPNTPNTGRMCTSGIGHFGLALQEPLSLVMIAVPSHRTALDQPFPHAHRHLAHAVAYH
jgi:hypothetical protein